MYAHTKTRIVRTKTWDANELWERFPHADSITRVYGKEWNVSYYYDNEYISELDN